LVAAIGLGFLVAPGAVQSASAAPGPRPSFHLPFPCGDQWRLDSWGHAPALDMVRVPRSATEGSVIAAPADGVVNQSFYHSQAGNVIQINHGGGWFTTYRHMQVRYATAGHQVFQGQTIGRVGHTGPTSNGTPHLHFELAVDANGDGQASWGFAGSERVRPWFNGVEYAQSNGQTWLHVYSNNCGEMPGVASTSSRMHVFVRGTDRALYKKTYAGSWPVSWTRVDGSVLNSAPAAAAWRDANGAQRVDVFASGAPDANGITQVLQKTSYDDGNTFSGWQVIGGNLTTQPAATVLNGTLYLFGRGTTETSTAVPPPGTTTPASVSTATPGTPGSGAPPTRSTPHPARRASATTRHRPGTSVPTCTPTGSGGAVRRRPGPVRRSPAGAWGT